MDKVARAWKPAAKLWSLFVRKTMPTLWSDKLLQFLAEGVMCHGGDVFLESPVCLAVPKGADKSDVSQFLSDVAAYVNERVEGKRRVGKEVEIQMTMLRSLGFIHCISA